MVQYLKIKPITKTFLIIQLLDFITTFVGLNLGNGIYESNPVVAMVGWNNTIITKIFVMICVSGVFQIANTEKNKLYWIVVIPPILAVLLNFLVISTSFL